MITNLSDSYLFIHKEYIKIKKEIVFELLKLICKLKSTGHCLLCNDSLICNNDSIEGFLCCFCIQKTHTESPCFIIKKQYVPEKFKQLQLIIEKTHGIYRKQPKESIKTDFISYDELKSILEKESDKNEMKHASIPYFVQNFKDKLKRDRLKKLIYCRIKSRIEMLDDQLRSLEKNHSKAVISGNFDDSSAIKDVYFNIYESKIFLEEKLYKFC